MRKRAALARWLERAGILDTTLRWQARGPRLWLTVLTYHSIRPSPGAFDDGVIDASVEGLDRHLAMIRRSCSPITLDELRSALLERKPLPPSPLLVTFDDGYRDNFDLALPVLCRHGIRATFFVATSYITERRVFWWDRIAYLIRRSAMTRIRLDYPHAIEIDLRDRPGAIRQAQRIVKDTPSLDFPRFFEGLEAAARVPWTPSDERRFADELVLTWSQVRALRKAGMDVQSHTRTHRVLDTIPKDELHAELSGSRQELEEILGEPVRAVSYPVGRTIAGIPDIRDAVAAAGYDLGFSNASGINSLFRTIDPLDLRRISLDLDMDDTLFRGMLAIPPLGPR